MSEPTPIGLSQPVFAFRAWGDGGQGGLSALANPSVLWEPGANKASCYMHPAVLRPDFPLPFRVMSRTPTDTHPAPHHKCDCGWNASYDVTIPCRMVLNHTLNARVVGVVLLWGRIEAHCDGLRAEYSEILALADLFRDVPSWVVDALGPDAQRIRETDVPRAAKRYGVPSVPLRDLAAIGSEHGIPVASEYRFAAPDRETAS